MLRRINFWQDEREAPILRLNHDFLPSEDILRRIPDEKQDDLQEKFEHERIIQLDAERTFVKDAQRSTLMNVLSFLRHEFKSYHQAMSYVAGFLLLTHSSSSVIETMQQLHYHVLVGYWTDEPVAFATDAYVFDYLLADFDPETHQHLSKYHILPETYVQKWFTTLFVGVLPFEALFLLFDTFVVNQSKPTSSNEFLFQLALSLMKHIREGILDAKNVATIYGYLRFDSTLPHIKTDFVNIAMQIVQHAKDYDLSQYDIKALRQKAFDEKLRIRLEAARRVHQMNEEKSPCITSSEDEDEDEEEEEQEKKFMTTMKTLVSQMNQMHIE